MPELTVEDLIEAVREVALEDLGVIGILPYGPMSDLVELINERLPENVPPIPTTWEGWKGDDHSGE